MTRLLEYICVPSGFSVILQRVDRPTLVTEAPTQKEAMAMMRKIEGDEARVLRGEDVADYDQ